MLHKSPNAPFDTLKEIELKLQDRLKRQADGRWKYPPKENDETLAREIGKGATVSAVAHMRREKYLGGLVPQKIAPPPPPPPVVPLPPVTDPAAALYLRLYNELSQVVVTAVREAMDAYTRPSDH